MNILKLVRPDLLKLSPYNTENFLGKILLNANENPFPTPFNRYPEGRPGRLGKLLSKLYGAPADNIVITCGSDQAIDIITRTFCEYKNDKVLLCPPVFSMYSFYAAAQGVEIVNVPLTADYELDVKNIINKKVKLVFIPNPSAPLGKLFKREDIIKIIASMPRTIVVVDEAYIEFSKEKSFIALQKKYKNLLVMRTLSKAWGMAGLRLGCVVACKELAGVMSSVLPPYPITRTAIASAEKILCSAAAKKKLAVILKEKQILEKELAKIPFITPIKSAANFIFFKTAAPQKLADFLMKKGIAVRVFPLGIRVSVGTPAENKKFLAALSAFKGKA